MKITALQEYGMRCLLQLAEKDGAEPVQIRAIADNEGLSADYVGKILSRLRKSGLVKSVRGLNGGYVLTRDPDKIFIGSAIMALSENPVQLNHLKRDLCGQYPGNRKECIHMRACGVRQVWTMIIMEVFGSLNKIPLSILLGNESDVQNTLRQFMKNKPLMVKNVTEKPAWSIEK